MNQTESLWLQAVGLGDRHGGSVDTAAPGAQALQD